MRLDPVIAHPPRSLYRDALTEEAERAAETEAEVGLEEEEAGRGLDVLVGESRREEAVVREREEEPSDLAGVSDALYQLKNTIPKEVLVLWAALEGAVRLYGLPFEVYVALVAFITLVMPVYVYRAIEKPDTPTLETTPGQWWDTANIQWQSLLSAGAFLVWVYYLGGPFAMAGLQDPGIAAILVIIYPVLVVTSQFYGSYVIYQLEKMRKPGTERSQDTV
ncbi:hypothetical protein GJR96_02275 [Haloferax sp. MBLA0076]|uniref:Uncharacterized protein n=1 Tax=Haloferax litoreum TaxID=2666140 RepID=A0A6A8GG52_9EURY|nr:MULTISPECIES: hypothetical protein [Haloferax]KAB1192329.1 hypothetical protein Hfx1148_02260 [Haloferax sp. CBA1148]MRX20790.1 hypothetical protein [Haloferax litoreum]